MSLFPASLTASLDDVVFEGRNQAYGAYQLRQDYQHHLASAGGITLGMCALLLLGWLAWPATHLQHARENHVILETITPPLAIEQPKQAVLAPPPRAKAVATHQASATSTQVARDQDVIVPPKPAPVEAVVDGPVGPAVADASASGLETGPVTGPTTSETTSSDAAAVTGPYIVVEKMPEFAGGQAALLRYLQTHLRYPAAALAAQAEGRVFLSFVVQADGSIADVAILKGLGYGLDEEAQRVVRQMPAWTPGYQSKHAVPVRFTLPITFKIQ